MITISKRQYETWLTKHYGLALKLAKEQNSKSSRNAWYNRAKSLFARLIEVSRMTYAEFYRLNYLGYWQD